MNPNVTLPAKARLVLYVALALAFAVVAPLVAVGTLPALYLVILTNIGGVFGFALASTNVHADVPTVMGQVEPPSPTND